MNFEQHLQRIVQSYGGMECNTFTLNSMADDIRKLTIAAGHGKLLVCVRGPTQKEIHKSTKKGNPHPPLDVYIGFNDESAPPWIKDPDVVIRGNS